jgi:hypothetical protein
MSVRTPVTRNDELSFDVAEHFGIYKHIVCLSNGCVTYSFADCM